MRRHTATHRIREITAAISRELRRGDDTSPGAFPPHEAVRFRTSGEGEDSSTHVITPPLSRTLHPRVEPKRLDIDAAERPHHSLRGSQVAPQNPVNRKDCQ